MSKVRRFIKRVSSLGIRGYQDRRFPIDQYELIRQTDVIKGARNVLEIGCNQGYLVQRFANEGRFSVGVDIRNFWSRVDNGNAILGVYPVDLESISRMPNFDVICLLSVHHQWVRKQGDVYAMELLKRVYERSNLGIFVEFAAIASKYGYEQGMKFKDNDDSSICEFAEYWLKTCGFNKSTLEYLGKTREKKGVEPYRHIYWISRIA